MLQGLADEELDVVIVPDFGLHLDEGYEELELSSEQVRFMTGPHSALAGRQFVSSEELTGQTIFRVEDQSDDAKSQPLPEYYTRLGLANNPVQRVNTLLEATILVQAGLGIAPLPGGMEQKLARDVSVFSIEGDSVPHPHVGAAEDAPRERGGRPLLPGHPGGLGGAGERGLRPPKISHKKK